MQETPQQVRQTEDGGAEIWDNILQNWRPVMALDRVDVKKKADKPDHLRADDEWYVCPDCGEDVNVLNNTRGWELRRICPMSGDTDDLVEEEIVDADVERYECAEGCGWNGYYDWYRDVTKRKNAPQRPPKPEPIAFDIEAPGAEQDLWPDFDFITPPKITLGPLEEAPPKETGNINVDWQVQNLFKLDPE